MTNREIARRAGISPQRVGVLLRRGVPAAQIIGDRQAWRVVPAARPVDVNQVVRVAIMRAFETWERAQKVGSEALLEGTWLFAEIDREVREALGCSPEDWDPTSEAS